MQLNIESLYIIDMKLSTGIAIQIKGTNMKYTIRVKMLVPQVWNMYIYQHGMFIVFLLCQGMHT